MDPLFASRRRGQIVVRAAKMMEIMIVYCSNRGQVILSLSSAATEHNVSPELWSLNARIATNHSLSLHLF
jgi:hypothetical protein